MRFKSVLEQGIPFGIASLIYQEVLQGTKSEADTGRKQGQRSL